MHLGRGGIGAVAAVLCAAVSARSLETAASWTGEGNQASAHAGWAVAPAGDVDGDGFTDLLVGARDHDAGQTNEGRVVLYRGSAAGPSVAFDWKAEGDQLLAFFASAVAPAGDVNGDGYADLIVGAPSWDGDLSNEGAAFVWHGGPSGPGVAADWRAEGDQVGAAFGGSVAGCGDVNGDGYDDVIVGARGHDASFDAGGRAAVFHGGPSGLAAAPAWNVYGDQTDAALGVSVAGAGDVNGDGYADVIVGAFFRDAGQTDEGCAFVYLGSASGLSTTPVWTGEGNQAGASFGWSVAGAGDVNGDGYADVVVGARDHTTGFTDEGRVWVFHGAASGVEPAAAWFADGGEAGAFLGWSVATAGDVNGDGYADVIAGAYKNDVNWSDDGEARVWLGSAGGLRAAPAWTATSAQTGAQFGYSVSGAGDVDGDGYGDLVIGAPFFDAGQTDEGAAFLYRGGAELPEAAPSWRGGGGPFAVSFGFAVAAGGDANGDGFGDLLVTDPFSTVSGEGRADLFAGGEPVPDTSPAWSVTGGSGEGLGRAAAFAGDVDGDGFDDVLLGAPFATDTYAAEGRTALYRGSVFGPGATPAWTSVGGAGAAEFGAAVCGAGDVNGDGRADVLVGAPGADFVRVYHGVGAAPWLAAAPTIAGAAGSRSGATVAPAGDVNRDGYSDALLGAPSAAAGGFERGSVHLRLGGPGGLAATDAWTFAGAQDEAHLGEAAAAAGDVNGDGYSDVLVLAPDHDVGTGGEGRAYLFLGGAAGLAAAPAWEWSPAQGGARLDAAAAAGDVNGDGFGDVILGASRHDAAFADEGRAFLFLGGASGLAATPARTWDGGAAFARFGGALGGRGDADGDGFAELFLGARGYADTHGSGGAAFLVAANGGEAPTRRLRQRRTDDTRQIALRGASDAPDGFLADILARSAAGRVDVAVDVQAATLAAPFGAGLAGTWIDPGAPLPGEGSRALVSTAPSGFPASTPLRWRARVRARSPYFPASQWISPAANGATEMHLRTGTLGASAPQAVPIGAARLTVSPTPFRVSTEIALGVDVPGHCSLRVVDVAGRLVRLLLDRQLPVGERRVRWDGRDQQGHQSAAGVYFVHAEVPGAGNVVRVLRLR